MNSLLTVVHGAAHHQFGICDVLIGGSRVLAVGTDLQLSGLGVREIDARGLLLWPGYVDGLVHIGGGGGEGGFSSRMAPLQAPQAIAAGVTSLIGALGTDDVTRSHADLLAQARALQVHGLSTYTLTGSYHVPVRTLTGSIRSDLCLIPEMIGVGEVAVADHRGAQPSVRELARIASEAHVGGMLGGKAGMVLVHMGDFADGLAPLIQASKRHAVSRERWLPTHINRSVALAEAGFRYAREGGYIDLTTSTTEALVQAGDCYACDILARALAAGVPNDRITLSSDGQASLPLFDDKGQLVDLQAAPIASLHHDVVRAIREFGVAVEAVLATVTRNPARIWKLPRKGRVEAGSDADLLLLDPDSLAIRYTIAGGVVHAVAR